MTARAGGDVNVRELKAQLDKLALPADAAATLLHRIDGLGDNSAGAGRVARTLALPWAPAGSSKVSLADVHGMLGDQLRVPARARDEIVELLAVQESQRAAEDDRASAQALLCLAGPRGVGTSTIARQIGLALGRPVEAVDLPQLGSAAEFFGSEKSPGALMRAVERAGAADAIIILEGLDRFGSRWQTDPHALVFALTDPERRAAFQDPFFGVPFDLSRMLPIATARWTHGLPSNVRERMAIIEVEGYVHTDKLAIASEALLPSIMQSWGLAADGVAFDDDALLALIRSYTDDAGLAQLESLLRQVVRRVLLQRLLDGDPPPERISPEHLAAYVGRPPAATARVRPAEAPGRAGTLIVGPEGGAFGVVEAANMPGTGQLTMSGRDGSDLTARLATVPAYVRSKLSELGVSARLLEEFDTHLLLPVGALPGDEGAVGMAAAIALVSMMRDRAVDPELAATGSITLHGSVLPALGIRHKMLAAHRAGVRRVLLPRANERDLDDLPPLLHDDMTFIPVEDVGQALHVALR